jgi:hypothetical protein
MPGSAEFPAPLPLTEFVAGRRCLSNSAVLLFRKAAVRPDGVPISI